MNSTVSPWRSTADLSNERLFVKPRRSYTTIARWLKLATSSRKDRTPQRRRANSRPAATKPAPKDRPVRSGASPSPILQSAGAPL